MTNGPDQAAETMVDRPRGTSRRSFLGAGLPIGAGAIGAELLTGGLPALAQTGGLTKRDVAILQFLAAIELIETDLWQQYNELGGIVDGRRGAR